MPRWLSTLISYMGAFYFFASSGVLVIVNAFITLFTCWFDKNRRATHYFSCWWGYHYFQLNPWWRITYEGLDNIDPNKTYVLVANHNSLADILILYGTWKPFKWVSKEEILKMPFVGWNMILNEYVTLRRGKMSSIKEMMSDCKRHLERGASIMMFPEGTRSEDGEIQSFRGGAFSLALDCKVPVVPIVLNGTYSMLPRKKPFTINWNTKVTVRVLPPVMPDEFEGKPGKLKDHVHKLMVDTLDDLRGKRLEAAKTGSDTSGES